MGVRGWDRVGSREEGELRDVIRRLVAQRFGSMQEDDVLHATRLFALACIQHVALAPKRHCWDQTEARFFPVNWDSHSDELVRLLNVPADCAAGLIKEEWARKWAEAHPPFLPLDQLHGGDAPTTEAEDWALTEQIPTLLRGAVICAATDDSHGTAMAPKYELTEPIHEGKLGRGWRGKKIGPDPTRVYIKTFYSQEEFDGERSNMSADGAIPEIYNELTMASRLQGATRLNTHENMARVLDVFNMTGQATLRTTGGQEAGFLGIVWEYLDGTELWKYVYADAGRTISEAGARPLLRQLVGVLDAIHPPDGPASFHAGVRVDSVFLVNLGSESGPTLKLRLFGESEGATPRAATELDCATGLRGAGLILLEMLTKWQAREPKTVVGDPSFWDQAVAKAETHTGLSDLARDLLGLLLRPSRPEAVRTHAWLACDLDPPDLGCHWAELQTNSPPTSRPSSESPQDALTHGVRCIPLGASQMVPYRVLRKIVEDAGIQVGIQVGSAQWWVPRWQYIDTGTRMDIKHGPSGGRFVVSIHGDGAEGSGGLDLQLRWLDGSGGLSAHFGFLHQRLNEAAQVFRTRVGRNDARGDAKRRRTE